MAIIDREAREALIQTLEGALVDARELILPETTALPGGDIVTLAHQGISKATAGGPTLHTLSLTFVAESLQAIESILALVSRHRRDE